MNIKDAFSCIWLHSVPTENPPKATEPTISCVLAAILIGCHSVSVPASFLMTFLRLPPYHSHCHPLAWAISHFGTSTKSLFVPGCCLTSQPSHCFPTAHIGPAESQARGLSSAPDVLDFLTPLCGYASMAVPKPVSFSGEGRLPISSPQLLLQGWACSWYALAV